MAGHPPAGQKTRLDAGHPATGERHHLPDNEITAFRRQKQRQLRRFPAFSHPAKGNIARKVFLKPLRFQQIIRVVGGIVDIILANAVELHIIRRQFQPGRPHKGVLCTPRRAIGGGPRQPFQRSGTGDGNDLAIVTYGNGTYLSQRAAHALSEKGVSTRIIDLRWLAPLPMDAAIDAIGACKNVLIVDECRKSGSPSEEIIAQFIDRGLGYNLRRITGVDTFIPLGPAADEVLISETDIIDAALSLTGKANKRAAE